MESCVLKTRLLPFQATEQCSHCERGGYRASSAHTRTAWNPPCILYTDCYELHQHYTAHTVTVSDIHCN